ncbi:MAG: DUF2752 domain-containing protein [Myxococcota bacterium]|nr:DUF2752 domain-containing protein [Myxococcota bacterium]
MRTGWPCPMCGMTTAFSHFAHGHLVEGFLTQPFGAVLFGATLTLFMVGLLDLVRPVPRPRWRRILERILEREVTFSLAILGGLLLGWLYKSWTMGKFLALIS